MTIAYPWEGPRTYVRLRITRGSASGSNLAGNELHIFAGYTRSGDPVSLCAIGFDDYITRSRPGDERICENCLTHAEA